MFVEYRIGEHLSTKSPDGRPARLTHKYTATITDIELSRMRQDITTEYKRRDGNSLKFFFIISLFILSCDAIKSVYLVVRMI